MFYGSMCGSLIFFRTLSSELSEISHHENGTGAIFAPFANFERLHNIGAIQCLTIIK